MPDNLYRPPTSELLVADDQSYQYGGFWVRLGATLVDTVLLLAISVPLLALIYGLSYRAGEAVFGGVPSALLNYVFPAFAVIMFWIFKSATPGKMLFNLSIVDATTGAKPRTRQLIGRYLAYYLSMLPLLIGFLWVATDKRKQGWHDKLAGTVVIRPAQRAT